MKRILSNVWYRLLLGAVLGGLLGVVLWFVFCLTKRSEVYYTISVQGVSVERMREIYEQAEADARKSRYVVDNFTRYTLGFVFVLMCTLAGLLIAGFNGPHEARSEGFTSAQALQPQAGSSGTSSSTL